MNEPYCEISHDRSVLAATDIHLRASATPEARICRDVIVSQWNSAVASIVPTILAFNAARSSAGIQYSTMVWPPTWCTS